METNSDVEDVCETQTPLYSHIWEECFKQVYEPAEDTFLLLDALEADGLELKKLRPQLVLEVGVGSGLVLAFARKLLGPTAFCLGTDVNKDAVICGQRTSITNSCFLEFVQDDLVTSLRPRLHGSVDLLLFNPPYVVTETEEVGSRSIEAAWAGGKFGREVIDRFLPLVADLLSVNGIMYLVVIDRNKPEEILHLMNSIHIDGKVVAQRKAGIENLRILKFWRKKTPN